MNVGKGFVEMLGWGTVVGQREETVKEAMVIRMQNIHIYVYTHAHTHTHKHP